ncbi:40S ribosomal protein S30, putative [Leishmania tarentolae]|uniref:40S ribosomal protein S30, putative n=1 Tax=Leishmania tarentolae TaxID=5689 RepID=A0A640KLR1_LEITA|nr:40S ribosomal protein S30, putative [Leishmania tarentolae]
MKKVLEPSLGSAAANHLRSCSPRVRAVQLPMKHCLFLPSFTYTLSLLFYLLLQKILQLLILIMGKIHGSLARAGKVKNQTPKVAKQEKRKQPRGRALKRLKYTRRFLSKTVKPGEKVHMNKQPPGKAG